MYFKRLIQSLYFLILLPMCLNAHAPNQSYIFLAIYQDSITGNYQITTNDINKSFDLNLSRDADMEALNPHFATIKDYLIEHSAFSSKFGEHKINVTGYEIFQNEALGTYVKINFKLENLDEIPDEIDITYNAIFAEDPTHRGIQVITYNWKAGILDNEAMISLTFSPEDPKQTLDLTDSSIWKGIISMIQSGIHHIWIGLDHILFLLALILPGVVRRIKPKELMLSKKENGSLLSFSNISNMWEPVKRFKPALIYIIKIISFFTIAHTITLSLAALEIINLSSRFVEATIAISIALAAFHNIRPIFKNDWVIAFGFGLFHGFGFASVLGGIGLTGEFMVLSLLGFNLGVEIGQIAIIGIMFPILYLIRKSRFYPYVIIYGSILLILISFYWFTERAFEIDLPLGKIVNQILGR